MNQSRLTYRTEPNKKYEINYLQTHHSRSPEATSPKPMGSKEYWNYLIFNSFWDTHFNWRNTELLNKVDDSLYPCGIVNLFKCVLNENEKSFIKRFGFLPYSRGTCYRQHSQWLLKKGKASCSLLRWGNNLFPQSIFTSLSNTSLWRLGPQFIQYDSITLIENELHGVTLKQPRAKNIRPKQGNDP